MTSTLGPSFAEPVPQPVPSVYREFDWPAGATTSLQPGPDHLSVDVAAVAQNRQSSRAFAPIQLAQLGALLWLTCRTHSRRDSPFGFQQQFRPHPSAGAMHPIHVLCQLAPGQPWSRYDPVAHSLVAVGETDGLASKARAAAGDLLAVGEGVLIALVAEPGKTAAKYLNHGSLVWRDAGVVLGLFSFITAALGLAFCPLGLTGHDFIAPIATEGVLEGVGLAIVGDAPRPSCGF